MTFPFEITVPLINDVKAQMAIDRRAFVDIMTQGQGDAGGAMQPGPAGRSG